MKKINTFYLALLWCFSSVSWATSTSPIQLLQNMVSAHKNTNYELRYILQKNNDIESFQYRHTTQSYKEFAQLLRLDNSREEIILRDNTVSYLGLTFKPFSLKSSHILDNLPAILYTDFSKLKDYQFTLLGKSRVADRIANIIKIAPSDNSRYQYTLWIDDENSLLLKSHLQDYEGQILEQFKVISQYVGNELLYVTPYLESLKLPPVIDTSLSEQNIKQDINWKLNWLPSGFYLVKGLKQGFITDTEKITKLESQLYSDGIFSFTVYVFPTEELSFNEQFFKQGNLTIFSHTVEDKNIVLIGDIPTESAKKIVFNITF